MSVGLGRLAPMSFIAELSERMPQRVHAPGTPEYEAGSHVFAGLGTPEAVVAKLSAETRRILDLPDMRDRLLGLGAQPAGSTPEEFAQFVQGEVAKWAKVIRDANVTLN